jgi:hypothetical protein
VFDGKHETLIPSGKPMPASAQYWSSDPRPSLRLYRGPSGTTEKDHFLGVSKQTSGDFRGLKMRFIRKVPAFS